MAIMDWIYDHSPRVVQNWLDQRAWDKDVAEQYDLYYERQKQGLNEIENRLNNPEIDRYMSDLPVDADENVRNHFAQQAARGISPAETHKEMWDDYEAWVANQEPIKHVKNGGLVKDKSDGTEYNYSIGKSDVGFHYSINEWPLVGHDREGEYSIKAYPTLEEAERAAQDNMPDLRDYAAECQEAIARTWERDQDEIELDEDEYDRAGRDDDDEEELER